MLAPAFDDEMLARDVLGLELDVELDNNPCAAASVAAPTSRSSPKAPRPSSGTQRI